MTTFRSRVTGCVATVLFTMIGHDAPSQTRTIKIVVASSPGGVNDIMARLLAEQIGRVQGPTIIVENRPGAGEAIGTEAVARAAPDGNTVLIAANPFIINPQMRKVGYDPLAHDHRRQRLVILSHARRPHRGGSRQTGRIDIGERGSG
jgi:tripartite-type tricarboxylate transporter receptor subunit TctC